MKSRIAVLIIGLFLVGDVFAGGFGGFGRALKRNLRHSIKRRAHSRKTRMKCQIKQRLTDTKANIVNTATGGLATGTAGGIKSEIKCNLKERLRQRASQLTPLAGAESVDDVKYGFKESMRARIEEMRSRLSAEALKNTALENVTGGSLPATDPEGRVLSLKERIRARIEAVKNAPKEQLEEKIDQAGGIIDKIGGSSGRIDLNTATVEELASVDGIDEEDATKIVDFRDQNGSIATKDLIDIVGYRKYLLLRTELADGGNTGGDTGEEAGDDTGDYDDYSDEDSR